MPPRAHVAVTLLLALGLGAWALQLVQRRVSLTFEPAAVVGVVRELEPAGAQTRLTYEFEVRGTTYRETQAVRTEEGFTPGSQVVVVYDPDHPETSCVDGYWPSKTGFTVLGCLSVLSLGACAWGVRRLRS